MPLAAPRLLLLEAARERQEALVPMAKIEPGGEIAGLLLGAARQRILAEEIAHRSVLADLSPAGDVTRNSPSQAEVARR